MSEFSICLKESVKIRKYSPLHLFSIMFIAWVPCAFLGVVYADNGFGTVLEFQQGVDNGFGVYSGTRDTFLHSLNSNVNFGTDSEVEVDDDSSRDKHGLTAFDDIIGSASGQIPLWSTIHSAILTVYITSRGDKVNLHRMVTDWDENTATWDGLLLNGNVLGGVQADGLEAFAAANASFTTRPGNEGFNIINVTADLQAWANGDSNFGWGFLPTGGDGVDWYSSEYSTSSRRPELKVDFDAVVVPLPPAVWMALSVLGGIGGYGLVRRRLCSETIRL